MPLLAWNIRFRDPRLQSVCSRTSSPHFFKLTLTCHFDPFLGVFFGSFVLFCPLGLLESSYRLMGHQTLLSAQVMRDTLESYNWPYPYSDLPSIVNWSLLFLEYSRIFRTACPLGFGNGPLTDTTRDATVSCPYDFSKICKWTKEFSRLCPGNPTLEPSADTLSGVLFSENITMIWLNRLISDIFGYEWNNWRIPYWFEM